MASRSVSPGGALLRASRVFAIPPPLPKPMPAMSSTGSFESDSGTLPHPILMSITTPQSSLVKGDWGLKRPLPLRATTKSSTPVIRVEKMDTYEHVTQFGSAADHTLSLQKWHEMGVPLSIPQPKRDTVTSSFANDRSVFEDRIDSTATMEAKDSADINARWKFSGPWLAGQTEGDFNAYLKEIRTRKNEFQVFLREACSKALTREYLTKRASVKDAGEAETPRPTADVTDEQLRSYILSLRQDTPELNKQIRAFLDLPPAAAPSSLSIPTSFGSLISETLFQAVGRDLTLSGSPYGESGPPNTHPSAGLAYGRTAATLYNHPTFGPQLNKPPVQARIVSPRSANAGQAHLGLGGFITNTPFAQYPDPFVHNSPHVHPGLNLIEPNKEGGSKVFVQPKSAWINSKGRVILKVGPANVVAVAIKEGTEIPRVALASARHTNPPPMSRSVLQSKGSGSIGYGVEGSL